MANVGKIVSGITPSVEQRTFRLTPNNFGWKADKLTTVSSPLHSHARKLFLIAITDCVCITTDGNRNCNREQVKRTKVEDGRFQINTFKSMLLPGNCKTCPNHFGQRGFNSIYSVIKIFMAKLIRELKPNRKSDGTHSKSKNSLEDKTSKDLSRLPTLFLFEKYRANIK